MSGSECKPPQDPSTQNNLADRNTIRFVHPELLNSRMISLKCFFPFIQHEMYNDYFPFFKIQDWISRLQGMMYGSSLRDLEGGSGKRTYHQSRTPVILPVAPPNRHVAAPAARSPRHPRSRSGPGMPQSMVLTFNFWLTCSNSCCFSEKSENC